MIMAFVFPLMAGVVFSELLEESQKEPGSYLLHV